MALREQQVELAARVSLHDALPCPLRRIAGLDVGFEDGGATTRAAAVLIDARTGSVIEQHVARIETRMPYIPGFLSFRELPALVEALAMLSSTPDLVFVDGHGVAHPRGLGVAAHIGVETGLPVIGVAKKVLVGEFEEPGPMPGDRTPLLYKGQRIGTVLRSKLRCRPLIVSPGHRVSHETAFEQVLVRLAGYRLPEPTRLADRLASRRDAASRA
ncbi:deoxyribonuclease V [Novilysobacter selenitireducens]|uniref:Endonuclease V n=1 Tax=Novilysobacter selenitireducens TaxID=2872639 RepID=A0ABS7T731_9GAMM|nr:deoxyribonuclease V [Lysobacter selenitireducens]MBZ4039696.1 deoxyribonuclease V [Lysobacter selenitireducens]